MPIARKQTFSIQLLQLTDACLVLVAFVLAVLLRGPVSYLATIIVGWFGQDLPRQEAALASFTELLLVVVPFTPLMLELMGFYKSSRKQLRQTLWQMIRGMVVLGAGVGIMFVFFKFPLLNRSVLGVGVVLSFGLILARDRAAGAWARRRMVRENLKEAIVLAGKPEDIEELLAQMPEEVTAFWRVVGHFDPSAEGSEALNRILDDGAVERVVFAPKNTPFNVLAEAIEICEVRGIEAWVSASFIQTQVARPTFDSLGGKPMLVLRSTPELSWELFIKGAFDRVCAVVMIVTTVVLWLPAIVGIMLASPGAPVFFSQQRAGRYGKPFRMWKLRTMVPGAEKLLNEVKRQHGNEMCGPVFKLENDPRVFPLGAWLRRLSIDELPQLINVVRGEMSIVGPRPLPVYEVEAFERSAHRRRLSIKPGMTCIWQVSGRNRICSFEEWVKMDLDYIDRWSLWLDLKILVRTVPAVLFAKGAK
jgi:exopolysaccharide biosynthesis polyprenyl glycosylphosphotransferase